MSLAFISTVLFGDSEKENIEKTRKLLEQYVEKNQNQRRSEAQ